MKKCPECDIEYVEVKTKPHKCGEIKCHNCSVIFTQYPHYCMMKTSNIDKLKKEDSKNKIIVAFDIESCQYEDNKGKSYHRPNLLIASKLFNENILIKMIT